MYGQTATEATEAVTASAEWRGEKASIRSAGRGNGHGEDSEEDSEEVNTDMSGEVSIVNILNVVNIVNVLLQLISGTGFKVAAENSEASQNNTPVLSVRM